MKLARRISFGINTVSLCTYPLVLSPVPLTAGHGWDPLRPGPDHSIKAVLEDCSAFLKCSQHSCIWCIHWHEWVGAAVAVHTGCLEGLSFTQAMELIHKNDIWEYFTVVISEKEVPKYRYRWCKYWCSTIVMLYDAALPPGDTLSVMPSNALVAVSKIYCRFLYAWVESCWPGTARLLSAMLC